MREELKQVLREILGDDPADDVMIAVRLVNACSLAFAYPERYTQDQQDKLRAGFIQLGTKGFI
jgi:hypothetical protein